jgi:hypothetical protein
VEQLNIMLLYVEYWKIDLLCFHLN